MNILIVYPGIIPAINYGGTERAIWSLGQELNAMGHSVTYLVNKGSTCPFGKILVLDKTKTLDKQVPDYIDLVHFTYEPGVPIAKPYVIMMQGNINDKRELDANTIFVSSNHASRYGSTSYVLNGLNWDGYTKPDWSVRRSYFHFLANAAWRLKNVKGAIAIAKGANEQLYVLGGTRLNIKMGFRLTLTPKARFKGMVGGTIKDNLINGSKGLIFPVMWHEPFGIAIIESLFYGCPVFGTPYGSLPELVTREFGFLSAHTAELIEGIKNVDIYDRKKCHEYARDQFNEKIMTSNYLVKYEQVLNGRPLNTRKPQLIEVQNEKFLPFD